MFNKCLLTLIQELVNKTAGLYHIYRNCYCCLLARSSQKNLLVLGFSILQKLFTVFQNRLGLRSRFRSKLQNPRSFCIRTERHSISPRICTAVSSLWYMVEQDVLKNCTCRTLDEIFALVHYGCMVTKAYAQNRTIIATTASVMLTRFFHT